jgi:hypothetical protein
MGFIAQFQTFCEIVKFKENHFDTHSAYFLRLFRAEKKEGAGLLNVTTLLHCYAAKRFEYI